MPQSLVHNLIHLVYSTKQRRRWIYETIRHPLYQYQAAIHQEWESPILEIGGTDDHVHTLFRLSKNHPLKKVVEEVKKSSSKWMKKNESPNADFQWQTGYAAFSVSESVVTKLRAYIVNQPVQHRKIDFADELRAMLRKHQIPFDERYLWD